jgi:hypothetical protein
MPAGCGPVPGPTIAGRRPSLPATRPMTEPLAKILVADDEPDLRALLQRYLSDQGYSVRAMEGVPAGRRAGPGDRRPRGARPRGCAGVAQRARPGPARAAGAAAGRRRRRDRGGVNGGALEWASPCSAQIPDQVIEQKSPPALDGQALTAIEFVAYSWHAVPCARPGLRRPAGTPTPHAPGLPPGCAGCWRRRPFLRPARRSAA